MTDQTPHASSEAPESKEAGPLKRWGPILAIVAAAIVIYLNGWHEYLSLSKVAENREYLQNFVSSNLILAILIYVGLYIAIVAFSLPGGAPATITGGFLFGWGVMVWALSGDAYDAAPEAVRKAVLTGTLAWFCLDSAGSVASGTWPNVFFNIAILLIGVGPMWRPEATLEEQEA